MPQGQAPGPIAGPGAEEGPPLQLQLPPAPDLPPMPKGTAPPAAAIGVLGIPEIMRASTAAQQVEKVIGERREKLNADAQKEQAQWRDMQQGLANDRAKMSADQIRAKERELQERITNAQRTFRDRNRVIQEAGQYGLAQIERMLIGVIRQVAESRSMNLVLHRAQVALNVNEFDITELVVEQLNKVLPSVSLPPEGVSPPMAALTPPQAPAAGASGGTATPAAAPPSAPSASPANAPAPRP
jgi:Skp family chaperone for outer membrane proteins